MDADEPGRQTRRGELPRPNLRRRTGGCKDVFRVSMLAALGAQSVNVTTQDPMVRAESYALAARPVAARCPRFLAVSIHTPAPDRTPWCPNFLCAT